MVIIEGSEERIFISQVNAFYEIKKPSRRDAHCGVSGRCRDAAAAGTSFASDTLFQGCELYT